ncbi:MAG: porin [Fulvivirga sp.]
MKKLFTLLTVLFCFTAIQRINAQDDEDKGEFSLSGSVDAYFRGNLNAKNSGDGYQAPGTSFANLPGFSLGMFNLIGTYEGEKGGFVADLAFGPRGEDAIFQSPYHSPGRGSSQIVNQLYVYYNVTDNLTLSLGNFNTYLGYELISPASNFNYSTSYMFSSGPFSHTGLKADIAVSDDFTVMAAIMNPTDMTEFNPFGTYTMGLQFGLFGSTYLNFLYGDQDGKIDKEQLPGAPLESAGSTFQADLTTGFDLTDKFYLGVNATYNTTSVGESYDGSDVADLDGDGAGFYGAAAYLQLKTSESFGIGTRIEYFNVFNGGSGIIALDPANGDGNVINVTLSGNAKIGNLTIIPEIRMDATSEDTFLNNDLEPSSNLTSFVLAAVYSF